MSLKDFETEISGLNNLFDKVIEDYHFIDEIDQPMPQSGKGHLFYEKCWIDTVQWHLEDEIRRPGLDAQAGMLLKKRIDYSNQERTNKVEQIDDGFVERFKEIIPEENARLNTESPAWALDRLSILALKIFHMRVETLRDDADTRHIENCLKKLDVLLEQRRDLSLSIAQLLEDISTGKRFMKVYRQMKMYNDPKLNPALYKSDQ